MDQVMAAVIDALLAASPAASHILLWRSWGPESHPAARHSHSRGSRPLRAGEQGRPTPRPTMNSNGAQSLGDVLHDQHLTRMSPTNGAHDTFVPLHIEGSSAPVPAQ